ncbi:MAG: hypothetical protein KDD51_10420, partial [Bdellovibrionales bacterium]|nr:hypothetical protein [Bdellovibrionales bacterium]
MRKLSFLLLFCLAQSPLFAVSPPPELCAIILSMVPDATQNRIDSYFEAARGHVYNTLRPEMRRRLVEASVAMMSLPSENAGKRVFAGENWGATAIAHLWLLGVPPDEIRTQTAPLLEEYFATRVEPGLLQLRQGRDFRSPTEPLPPAQLIDGIDITVVRNGDIVVGSGSPFSEAIRTGRLRHEIDSDFSETTPAIVYDHFEGALLSGNRLIAEKTLEYILLLDKESDAAISGLEALGRQEELLSLGSQLFAESNEMIERSEFDFHLTNKLSSAISALARVTQANLKPSANNVLLEIARLTSMRSFHALFGGEDDGDRQDVIYTNYDIALRALQATGTIIDRSYIDSVQVELTFALGTDQTAERELIASITDHYVTLTHRMSESQFHEVRRALLAIGDTARLSRYGDLLFEKRARWSDDWFATNVYDSAIEFYVAAGNTEGTRRVILALLKEFEYVDSFSRDNRRTIARDDLTWKNMVRTAAQTNDAATMRALASHAEDLGWQDWVEQIAALQSGEPVEALDPFPHVPQIPTGLEAALFEDQRMREWFNNVPAAAKADRPALIEEGREKIEAGEVDEGIKLFLRARHAEGIIDVGERYLAAHLDGGGGAAQFGASA